MSLPNLIVPWEYMVTSLPENLDDRQRKLNHIGMDGWELVALTTEGEITRHYNAEAIGHFKRRKDST